MSLDNQNIQGLDAAMHKLEQAKQYIQQDVPVVIGVEAVKHFKGNFQTESFDGTKWASRKSKRAGGTNGQKVLSKSGELSESITYRVEGTTIIISSDKPYAQIHNEGFNGEEAVKAFERTVKGKKQTVKEHTRHMVMPKREFIGDSKELMDKINAKVTRDLTRIIS